MHHRLWASELPGSNEAGVPLTPLAWLSALRIQPRRQGATALPRGTVANAQHLGFIRVPCLGITDLTKFLAIRVQVFVSNDYPFVDPAGS